MTEAEPEAVDRRRTVEYTAEDEKLFGALRKALNENAPQPLTQPMGIEALTKSWLPLMLALLVGANLLDAEALRKIAPFEALTPAVLRHVIALTALLVVVVTALSLAARWFLAARAMDVWRTQNTVIVCGAHEWFLQRAAPELRALRTKLDLVGATERWEVLEKQKDAGHIVVDLRPQRQTGRLSRLATALAGAQAAGRLPLDDEEEAALHRLLARQAMLIDFQAEQNGRMRHQARVFWFSFLSADILLLLLALWTLLVMMRAP